MEYLRVCDFVACQYSHPFITPLHSVYIVKCLSVSLSLAGTLAPLSLYSLTLKHFSVLIICRYSRSRITR